MIITLSSSHPERQVSTGNNLLPLQIIPLLDVISVLSNIFFHQYWLTVWKQHPRQKTIVVHESHLVSYASSVTQRE